MREIKEPDWKVLRHVHPLALERFCERAFAEIDRVCTMARRVTMRATSKSAGFANMVIGRWRVSSTIRGALMH